MVRKTVRVRAQGDNLEGVILQEGRASALPVPETGGAEVFVPGSVTWPSDGIGIRVGHDGGVETRAYPHREADGRIRIRAKATQAIKDAIAAGMEFMSVEYHALQERQTPSGVLEVLRALVDGAALTASPIHDTTSARLRSKQGMTMQRRTSWL